MSTGRGWGSSISDNNNAQWDSSKGNNSGWSSSVGGNNNSWTSSGNRGITPTVSNYGTSYTNGPTQEVTHSTQTLFGSSYNQHLHEQRQQNQQRQHHHHPTCCRII